MPSREQLLARARDDVAIYQDLIKKVDREDFPESNRSYYHSQLADAENRVKRYSEEPSTTS